MMYRKMLKEKGKKAKENEQDGEEDKEDIEEDGGLSRLLLSSSMQK